MSARHPLDNFIAGWLDENAEAFVFLSADDDENSDGMAELHGDVNVSALTRAIVARFGVVELPKYTPAVNRATVTDTGWIKPYNWMANGGTLSPQAARETAVALIVAADRAEASDVG